jgi:hypothetical protein
MKLHLTLLGVLLGLTTIVLLVTAFYYLFLEDGGGMGLAGVIALQFTALTGILLIVEQRIVSKSNASKKKILATELLIAIPILLLILLKVFENNQ